MDYRRAWHSGGTYFFTVNCLQRNNNDLLIRHIDHLKRAISTVKKTHPFKIHAWVVLPKHMHSSRRAHSLAVRRMRNIN
jgi:putative transposase